MGLFQPEGRRALLQPGLLKDILEHDQALVRNAGKVEVEGGLAGVNYYVTASRIAGIFKSAATSRCSRC